MNFFVFWCSSHHHLAPEILSRLPVAATLLHQIHLLIHHNNILPTIPTTEWHQHPITPKVWWCQLMTTTTITALAVPRPTAVGNAISLLIWGSSQLLHCLFASLFVTVNGNCNSVSFISMTCVLFVDWDCLACRPTLALVCALVSYHLVRIDWATTTIKTIIINNSNQPTIIIINVFLFLFMVIIMECLYF